MTLSALGIFSAAGAGGGVVAEPAYELIESSILASNQASVVFSNLGTYSSVYKHLQLRMVVRTTGTSPAGNFLYIRANGNTSAVYDLHQLNGSGSSVSSAAFLNESGAIVQRASSSANTANTYGGFVTDLLDAFSTTKNKVFRTMGGNTAVTRIDFTSASWRNTASITSLTILSEAGDLATGTRISLYGIKG